ncbi:DUF3247 family protein [Lysobacter sp. H21R4]|uniref:DUF3247 family protein n=1 Tax=Lysobacter sp. H21R4 TaxID=2781021 RepID=UPI00188755FF|nr:DUF3247 family protein [Lysobacter sp. H21R4]QOY62998.1 DUF3247 family protein [Lysobacter sp. H21R4]
MSRNAPRIHTEPSAIARLQERIDLLPGGAHVSLLMDDGEEIEGIVVARPSAQLFFGPDGSEGTNATVRLVQPAMYQPESVANTDVWLDRIVLVRRLDPEAQPAPAPGH